MSEHLFEDKTMAAFQECQLKLGLATACLMAILEDNLAWIESSEMPHRSRYSNTARYAEQALELIIKTKEEIFKDQYVRRGSPSGEEWP